MNHIRKFNIEEGSSEKDICIGFTEWLFKNIEEGIFSRVKVKDTEHPYFNKWMDCRYSEVRYYTTEELLNIYLND